MAGGGGGRGEGREGSPAVRSQGTAGPTAAVPGELRHLSPPPPRPAPPPLLDRAVCQTSPPARSPVPARRAAAPARPPAPASPILPAPLVSRHRATVMRGCWGDGMWLSGRGGRGGLGSGRHGQPFKRWTW
ncbi:unnamed protein product, partial [Iphiclides podalirius]